MPSRNIVNVEAVDAFLETQAALAGHAAIADWLSAAARNWILQDYDRYDILEPGVDGGWVLIDPNAGEWAEPRPYDGETPDWFDRAYLRGDTLIFLRLGGTLAKRLRGIVDYLDAQSDSAKDKGFARLGFGDAEVKAKNWHKKRRAEERRANLAPGAVPVMRVPPGVTVVQLTSRQALDDEAERMSSCVGSYFDEVEDGACEIYSLRNGKGESVATVEVDREGYVMQVKGRFNDDVPVGFRQSVDVFVRERGYRIAYDHANTSELVGWIEAELRDRTWDFDSFLNAPAARRLLRQLQYPREEDGSIDDSISLMAHLDWCWGDIGPAARRAVFRGLAPPFEEVVRITPMTSFWIYDRPLPVDRVEVPLTLFNMTRFGAFDGLPVEATARALMREAESRLVALAFQEPDRIFVLGREKPESAQQRMAYGYWSGRPWRSAWDFLAACDIELDKLIRARRLAIRRSMNRAKHRVMSKTAPASLAHETVRGLQRAWMTV
jgi:hypothetical protein